MTTTNYDNMSGCGTCIVFAFGIVIGALVTGMAITEQYNKHIQRTAIENDCGRFNPTTGKFEWLKKQKHPDTTH